MKQKLLLFLSLTLPLTATLISLQILAPDRFKPLTNRLLDYPHVTPSINLERGVFQTSFSPSHTASDISLHSYRSIQALLPQPLTIAKVVDDVYVPPKSSAPAPKKSTSAPRGSVTKTLKQEIQDIIINTPPAAPAIVVQPPKPIDERDDTPAPAPLTPAAPAIISPKQVLDEARQETYLTNYGAEAGRYGWNYDTGSPATTDQWNDPNAKIAGTYIGPNGQRYTVNLESTKQAESSFVNAIANKITTLSNDQVLDYAKELPGSVSCATTDTTCQQQLIKNTLAIIGQQSVATRAIDQSLTTAIQDAQQQNAAFQAKIATFLDPNSSREKILNCAVGNTSCRETTYEDYLKQLGVDKDSIPTLLADRQTNIQNQARLKKFYDPTASTADILECPPGAPKCGGKTLESFLANLNVDSDKIPDLIKERSTNIANYQTDLKLISKFADALISTSDLAKEVCSGDFGCVKDFNREDYLGSLHYQELAGNAKSAYQLSLFNFSKLVDEPSFKDLPATTQNTLLNANTSVQQAFAAYSFEKNKTPGTIVTPESSNQLALDFAKKIQANPDILKEYSAKFADHKDLYQGLIDTTRLFALTEGEKNAVTTAQLKDIAIHATISGLSNNGQVVAWDQAAPQYKEEARQLACKQDPSLTGLCRVYAQQGSTSTALLDEKIKNNSSQYLQQIFDAKTGANIQLSTSFSNVATVNNPLVDQQLVTKAIQFANQKADPNVPAYMTEQHYNPDFTPLTETEKTQLANQYLDRQLVTETYKVGGGLAAGMAGFSAGMTVGGLACVATGIGIAASPICALIGGAVGGISGALAAQVPLYEMTATEYQEQRGGDDLTHSIFQSLYSNQGAWGDEGMGRSITTRNNQFALYDAINTATDGQLISQIQANPELQANLAIQGQVLNQWEVNQNRQESWTYASLPIAAITGSLNVSVGSQLAKSFTGRAITESGFKALNVLSQAPTFAASTALNRVQTAAQFNSTGGDASLLTTPTQVAWQVCIMSQDPNSIECLNKKLAVDTEIATNKKFAMDQAFYTDLLMQIYQTATSFRQSQAQFRAQIDYAESQGITTTNRTLAAITADLAHLNDPNLTAKLAAAELTTNIPKIDQTQPISTDGLSELLMSKKVVQTEENGKPRLAFDQTHAPTSEETAVMTHVNNLLGVMEKTSGFDAILPEQLGAVTLSLDALATQKIAKTNSPDSLLLDQSVKPGVNPDAKTGGGKNTVIVPLLEKIALDGGQLTLHLAPEANMAGNRKTIENLRAFYDTDIYVAVNQKNAAGAVTDRYFTNLDGTRLPTETVLARIQQDGKAPMILADADTAMFALNEVIKIERGLAKSDSISSVWEKIWNSDPTVTADEVGTLSGHWQTTLGDPVAIAKLRKSQASLHLNDGAEVLSIYHATGDLEIIRQARSGELVLEKNPANRSLKPLPDEHTNQIIDISLEHAGSDKKIPSALKDELGRIQSLSNLDEKRHAFDTLRKHTPIELDTIYGKNASHAVALANAYNDAIYSRLSIIADIPGNDFRTVSGSVGTTIELAEGKTITGQQYSEVMLKLALQDEGSRALSIADTQLVPLDQLSIASQAVVVDLNDMFSHAGSMIGYDATDRLATAKTGLHAIYESTQLHAPKSVSLAQTLPETAVATARLVRDQFDQGKTALVIETNINKYSLDDATTAHTAAALKQLRPGENLYLALDNGDGSYQLYKVKGPDRTTWDLITGTPKSAEELYLASRTAIDADSTNNRLLALFENKTRGENFKPQTGIAPDIKESIVIGNPDTSISDTTQQGAGRVRVGGNDPAAEYHFVAYVDNQDTFNQLNSVSLTKPQDLPGIILSHLEQNQSRTEGYISLERNIKAINDGQVSNLIAHLYQDAQNNPKLIAQLAELENQIKNSGLAFATTPAEESTANALHDQYLFTRGRIENILTIAEQNGVPTQKISSLRITFNLDEPTLPLSSFAGMLKPNFDNSDLTGYHLALAKNIGTFENVPEKYLAGSPTQPVKSIASTLQPTTTSSLTSRVSTWIQAQIPTSIPFASSIASLVNYPTNLLATALRTASSIINPTIPVLNNQPIVNLLALPDTTLSFLTNDNQAIAFFRLNNTLYYQAENVDPIALTSDTDALAYLPSPDTISRIVLNDEDLDPSSYRAPGNLSADSPITKTPGEPIDLRNVGLITSTQKFVQNILSQLSISPAKITTPTNPLTATLSQNARDRITPILSRQQIDLSQVGLSTPTNIPLSLSLFNLPKTSNNLSVSISTNIKSQIADLLQTPSPAAPQPSQATQVILNPEDLQIKNKLNSNFEIILNDLPEAIPASFRQQARLAAYYFQALANNEALTSVDGQDLSNLANKFFDDFAHTGFVNAHYDYLNLTNQPTDDYYPSWITNKLASVRQGYYEYTEAEKTQIGQYFESYGHQSASSESNQQNGYYYNFYDVKGNKSLQQVQEISNPATNYKMYIENSDLLKTETIGKTLDTLALHGLHPHSYKLLENSRLVLYWDVLSIEQANAIQEIFSQSSIYVRGPAQDPVRIISTNNVPQMEIYWSNDSSLGENSSNPFKWENNQFNINEFYKQWLRLTFAANKNPSNPNQQSFIQAIIPENTNLNAYISQISQLPSNGLSLLLTHEFVSTIDLFNQQATDTNLVIPPVADTLASPPAVEQESVAHPLTTAQLELLHDVADNDNQPDLTRELLRDSRLFPKDALTIDGITFYLSAIIQTPGYQQALMYTMLQDGRIIPRVLYKSNSDGGWRSTPGYEAWNGIYSKGSGVSYTQETKPHEAINQYFNSTHYKINYPENLIKKKFNLTELLNPSQSKNIIITFDQEQEIYDDREVLRIMQAYQPGYYSDAKYNGKNFANAFGNFDFSSRELSGFLPKFTQAPEKIEKSNHTILGDITLETYSATLQGRPVKWVMAYDAQGRTWIERIYFADTKINSYGVYSEIINSGALTNKPLEYRSQISQLHPNSEYVDYSKSYVDITPLLSNLLPIRQFSAARNIKRVTPARSVASIKLEQNKKVELKKEDYPVDTPATIGRQSGNTLQLSGFSMVSRNHLSVYYKDNSWWYVEDLGTTNGTTIDGKRATANTAQQLTVGNHKIVLGTQATVQITVDPKTRNMTTTLLNRPLKGCSDCETVIAVTQKSLMNIDAAIAAKKYSEASRLLGLLTSYVQTDHRYTENLIQEGLIEQVLQRNAILVNHSAGFDAAIVHAQAAIQLTEALLEQNNVPLSILSSQTPQAYDAQELINPPYRDADMQLLLDFRYSMNDRKNWLIQEQKNAPQSTAVQTLGTKLHEQAGTIRQFIGTTLSFIRQDTKLQGELETIITPITQQSSSPKSAQQAALDALLGRTMGILTIPDFTEIGQNLAIWFNQKYGDLIGKGKRETTDSPTSTIQPISSEMTQILLSPLSDWFSSKSGLVDTYLSTKYKTGFSKTYLQQVTSTVQILNQVIPGKDAEILTINSPLSDIANKTNNLLEEEFVKDVRLSGNRALSQIKANHPSQIIEEIVSAPELLFNSKGQRVSMEEYLQDRYSELLTRGVKISINYLDAQEAINASGIEGSKLNLYDDVVSGLQSLGIKIPIIVVVTPEGKQYNIPLVNDPIDLDRLGAYGAFSSFVDSGGLLLRGRVKLIASSLHNIDDPADTNLLGSLTTILHELDHVIYGSIKSSHILSLKDERDLLSNKLTDHVANAKIILNSRGLTDLIKLLDKTNLEIIRVNHNDQDFAILLNRAKQVQRDIVQLAYGGNSQEYIDYQEVESLAEVKSSEYILSSVQYQNLDPVIAEGLSTRSEEAFLTIQKYYLKSSKVNSYELIKLFDFIINHTIIMRNSSSASQAIYGVGYDLITTPSDNPVLASANIYLDNLTAKYIQQSPQLFIAAIQYNINKAIDINEILYPNLSPNERAQKNQKIISAMLHNPDIFAIINQENLSIMSTAYDQYHISTKQEKAQIIASLENQIKADSNEEMISKIKLKAQEDDNYFEALLSYVHTIIPLKTFTENILSSKYDFSSELANLQDYVQNAPISPHSLTPLLPSSPKSAQQAALDALLGRTMGISAIPDFTEIGKNFASWFNNLHLIPNFLSSRFTSTSALPQGAVLLGKTNPATLTESEFENNPEILFHGDEYEEFAFSRDYDYVNRTQDNSTMLGHGFYTTPDKKDAELFSIAFRANTPHVTQVLPYQAIMYDFRDKSNPQTNTLVPSELVNKYIDYYNALFSVTWGNYQPENQPYDRRYSSAKRYKDTLESFRDKDVDFRAMLSLGGDPRYSEYASEYIHDFMLNQGYDGVIYVEGGDHPDHQKPVSYVFYNLDVVGDYQTWQNPKLASTPKSAQQAALDALLGRTMGISAFPDFTPIINNVVSSLKQFSKKVVSPTKLSVSEDELLPIDTQLQANSVDHIMREQDRSAMAEWAVKHLNFTNQSERFYKNDNPVVVELQQKLNELVDLINLDRKTKIYPLMPYTKLYITQNGAPNAYSMPDGSIVMSQSLINIMHSKDEVVAILTHELSHFEDHFLTWRESIGNDFMKEHASGALIGRLQEYKADYVNMRLKKIGLNGQAQTSALENLDLYLKEAPLSTQTKISNWLIKIFKIDTVNSFEIVADIDHGSIANRTGGGEVVNKMVEAGGRAIVPIPIPSSWLRNVSTKTRYEDFVNTSYTNDWLDQLQSLPPTLFDKYIHEFGGMMARNLSSHSSYYLQRYKRSRGALYLGIPQFIYDSVRYIRYAKNDISDLNKFEIITDILAQKGSVSTKDRANFQRLLLSLEREDYSHTTPFEKIESRLSDGLMPNILFAGNPSKLGNQLFANIKLDETYLNNEYIASVVDDAYWKNQFAKSGLNPEPDYYPNKIIYHLFDKVSSSPKMMQARFGSSTDPDNLSTIHQRGRSIQFFSQLPPSTYYKRETQISNAISYMRINIYKDGYEARDYDEARLSLMLEYYRSIGPLFPDFNDDWLYQSFTDDIVTMGAKLDTRIKVKKYLISHLKLNVDLSVEDQFYSALFTQDGPLFLQLFLDYPDIIDSYIRNSYREREGISIEQKDWMVNQTNIFINSPAYKTAKWDLETSSRAEKEFHFEQRLATLFNENVEAQLTKNIEVQQKYLTYLDTLTIWELLDIAHSALQTNSSVIYVAYADIVYQSPAVRLAQTKLSLSTAKLSGIAGAQSAYAEAQNFLIWLKEGKQFGNLQYKRDRMPFFGSINQEVTFLKPYIENLMTAISSLRPLDFPKTEETARSYYSALKSLPDSDQKARLIDHITLEMVEQMPFGAILQFVYDEAKNGDNIELGIKFLENRIQTYDEYKKTINKLGENFFKDMTTKATFKASAGVLLDSLFTNILNSDDSFDFFVAAMSGDDAKLRYYLGKIYYEGISRSAQSDQGVWLNKDTYVVEGPNALDYPTFDEILKKMYSLSKTQKTILLYKLLNEDRNGLLKNTTLHPKIADLVMNSIEDKKSTKAFLRTIIMAVLGQDRGRTKIALGVSSSLADVFLQHKEDTGNQFPAQEIVSRERSRLEEDARTDGRRYELTKEAKEKARLEDAKQVSQIQKLLDLTRPDVLNDPNNNNPDVIFLRQELENLYSSAFDSFGLPRNQEPGLMSESQKVPSAKFIVEVGKSLGALGIRFLQVMGQYFDISPDMQKDFQQVYDNASPLFMGNAFQTTDKAIETMQSELSKSPNEDLRKELEAMIFYRDNMFIINKMGGGSVNTAYIVTKKTAGGDASLNPSDYEAFKILNPNTQETLIKDTILVKNVISTLKRIDKRKLGQYQMADRLISTLEQWINEDVSDTKYLDYDPLFTEFYKDYTAPNGTHISYSETRSPYNEWVKVEGFVDGDTLKGMISNSTGDNPESLKTLNTEIAQKEKRVVEDFVSDYVRHLYTPVTLADGRVVRMLHSDLHTGNVMVSKDLNNGYVIDRSYYLLLEDRDVALVDKVFYENISDVKKLDSIIKYFLSENNIGRGINYTSLYTKLFIAGARHRGDENAVINALMQEMDKLDLTVPIRMRLFIKNMSAINRMLSYAGDKSLSDFLVAYHQSENGQVIDISQPAEASEKTVLLGILPGGTGGTTLTHLGARAGGSVLSALSISPLVSLLPDLPLLTYNTKTWIDNLNLIPNYLRNILIGRVTRFIEFGFSIASLLTFDSRIRQLSSPEANTFINRFGEPIYLLVRNHFFGFTTAIFGLLVLDTLIFSLLPHLYKTTILEMLSHMPSIAIFTTIKNWVKKHHMIVSGIITLGWGVLYETGQIPLNLTQKLDTSDIITYSVAIAGYIATPYIWRLLQPINWAQVKNFITNKSIGLNNYLHYIRLPRVVLYGKDIIKIMDDPNLINENNIIGMNYIIRNENGNIIKTGKLKQDHQIYLPIEGGHTLTISNFTISGAEIFQKYPEKQGYTKLENIIIYSILITSTIGFCLGFLTPMLHFAELQLGVNVSIYPFLKNSIGKNLADYIFGQLRDLSAITGLFAIDLLRNENTPINHRLKWALLRPNVMSMIFFGIEFIQANIIRRDYKVDIFDLSTFAIVPISTIIYFAYSYRTQARTWLQNLLGKVRTIGQYIESFFLSFWTPARLLEFLSASFMIVFELRTNVMMFPDKPLYRAMGISVSLPTDPFWAFIIQSLGDMLEVSVFFIGFRILLALANEGLKRIPKLKPLPDEAIFWISLVTSVVFFALHALGITIFGNPGGTKDYSGAPHFFALIGQGFATVVLTAAHYTGKYLGNHRKDIENLLRKLVAKWIFQSPSPALDTPRKTR